MSLFDHKSILLQWENISYTLLDKKVAASTSWDIQGFIDHLQKL